MSENSLDILINQRLWFSNGSNMNDPFECKMFSEEIFNKIWENYPIRNHLKDSLYSKVERTLNSVGICSFSKAKKNQLMWSHYANEHKGFCIGFDVERLKLSDNEINEVDVKYQGVYPHKEIIERINHFEKNGHNNNYRDITYDIIFSILRTKYTSWKYERELRLIREEVTPFTFNPNAINSITFGLKMDSEDKKQIIGLINTPKWRHMKIYQSYLSDIKFELIFKPLTHSEIKSLM